MTDGENPYESPTSVPAQTRSTRSWKRVLAWAFVGAAYLLPVAAAANLLLSLNTMKGEALFGLQLPDAQDIHRACVILTVICAGAAMMLGDSLQRQVTMVAPAVLIVGALLVHWALTLLFGIDLIPAEITAL